MTTMQAVFSSSHTHTLSQKNTGVGRSGMVRKGGARAPRATASRRPTKVVPIVRAAAAANNEDKNEDVQGDMLEPSLANNPLVRVASLVAVTAVSAKVGGVLLSAKLLAFAHMMGFGMWFGTLGWTSTVFGIVAFRNLPRQTFGKLQSKLFPKYFAVTGAMPLLLIGTLYSLGGGAPSMHEIKLLAIAAGTALANIAVAEPRATEVMFERYALENVAGSERDEARISALKKTFGKWHGISSLLNLVNLVCAVGHAFFLAGGLAYC